MPKLKIKIIGSCDKFYAVISGKDPGGAVVLTGGFKKKERVKQEVIEILSNLMLQVSAIQTSNEGNENNDA